MSGPTPPPPPPMAPPPPPPMMPISSSSNATAATRSKAPPPQAAGARDNSQLLREIERGVTLRKTPQAPTNSFLQQPRQAPIAGLQSNSNGGSTDEFEPIKQQLQDELNSTLRRRQNGQNGQPGSKPHFVVPKNSTINAIYNQLNELDNQKAAAALSEPYERKIIDQQPASIPNRYVEPALYYDGTLPKQDSPGLTIFNNTNNANPYYQNKGTLPRSTVSPSRLVEETKPKLLINHGKPNFVRPTVPVLRPKVQDAPPMPERPESNDITRTLRRLKSVELLDQGIEEESTPNNFELTSKNASKDLPVDNQNGLKNYVNNTPNKILSNPSSGLANTNVIFNNTNPRNSPFAERPINNGGSPFVTRKFPTPTPLPTKPEPTLADPSQTKNNGLPNFIRKLDPTDITDDMQLSDDIFLTHVRLNTGDANNIVYVPQGLPFKMVLNSTPIARNTAPLAEKPQYLQKSPPITNQPSAFNFGSPVPRSPTTSVGSNTPPELTARKSSTAAGKHILDQLQTLRKVDLKGDSSWMNRNNHATPPADEEPTAILAKEAVPFQTNATAVPHNPIITPSATIHHLRNNNNNNHNFDIRNVTSFAKDLMDAPNRYPDTVVVTNSTRHVDENGRVINETTFARKTVTSGGNGTAKQEPNEQTKFFSNLKFVIEENGDIRPNLTQLTH